jgi:L-histidine N-alpha-methyltransferase
LSHAEIVATVSPDVPDADSVIINPRHDDAARLAFAKSVALGLTDTPPWLHSHFLYDERGSQLFEEICEQPEYYLTNAEAEILQRYASKIRDETGPVTLIELGSGSSVKTDYLLAAYAANESPVRYVPVDVSETILEQAKDVIVAAHPTVTVTGIADTYEHAFPLFKEFSPAMVMFLGSSIGNFDQREADVFWQGVSAGLAPGDYLLVGVDLVKDESVLNAAYNDAAGVTAAFTKNLFVRINDELGASIDIDEIEHVARYNAEWQRMEIYARFSSTQEIFLEPIDRTLTVPAGTMVMTEISRKYDLEKTQQYLRCFDFSLKRVFTDERGWFGLLLLQRVAA